MHVMTREELLMKSQEELADMIFNMVKNGGECEAGGKCEAGKKEGSCKGDAMPAGGSCKS